MNLEQTSRCCLSNIPWQLCWNSRLSSQLKHNYFVYVLPLPGLRGPVWPNYVEWMTLVVLLITSMQHEPNNSADSDQQTNDKYKSSLIVLQAEESRETRKQGERHTKCLLQEVAQLLRQHQVQNGRMIIFSYYSGSNFLHIADIFWFYCIMLLIVSHWWMRFPCGNKIRFSLKKSFLTR